MTDPKFNQFGNFKAPPRGRFKGIPTPTEDLGSLTATVKAMKDNLELLLNQRGELQDSAATVGDVSHTYDHVIQQIETRRVKPIYEYEVQSAVASLTIDGLSALAHGGYYIDVVWYSTAATDELRLFVNGNTTVTNYYSQFIQAVSTTVTANRINAPNIAYAPASGDIAISSIDMNEPTHDGTGYITRWTTQVNYDNANVVSSTVYKTAPNFYTGDVNSITLDCLTGNLGVGTRVRVWRKK